METLSQLTTLIAAHGVYALSVIFIFFQQRRAVRNLFDARDGADKRYFRKVYTSVVIATYALVAASTVVWFYATFMYAPVKMITGEVSGLRKATLLSSDDNSVSISNQIAPERNDLEFYPVDDVARFDGGYRFRWAVFAKEDVSTLAFRFVHQYKAPRRANALRPFPTSDSSTSEEKPAFLERTIERRFVLDLGTISSLRRAIQLAYKPDTTDPTKVGTLWMHRPDGSVVAVTWASQPAEAPARSNSPQSRLLERFGLATLLAQSGAPALFARDGTYNADTGRALAIQLGSADLRTRLNARQMLVQAGPRSYRFVNDVLTKKVTGVSLDGRVLLDSLSTVVEEVELRGTSFPPQGHLKLAEAFYAVGDYDAAAYRFEKAGNITGDDSENLARQGHAYLEAGSFSKAAKALNAYLAGSLSPEQRVWALNALSVVYHQAGRLDESVAIRHEALKLAPNSASLLNGLAYTYAKQGKNLSEALALIDRALRQKPDFLEAQGTRGYILYKLGRFSEALPILRKNAVDLPKNSDAQNDLREAEQALRGRTVKPAAPIGLR